jgi:hypothetical protein
VSEGRIYASEDERPAPSGADAWLQSARVKGTLRLFHDGPGLPLWDDDGRLPDEPEFVIGVLGVSGALVADLVDWGDASEELVEGEAATFEERRNAHVAQGHELFLRLAQEVGHQYRLEYQTLTG